MTIPTHPLTLLVMAAGMGSRFGGMKQLEPIGPCGETLIDYSVFDAMRAGFSKIVFVIRKDMEALFKAQVASRFEKRIALDYVFQELDCLPSGYSAPAGRTKPWGTTQAVLLAGQVIESSFAVINADDYYGVDSYRILANHLRTDISTYAMVGFTLRNTLSDFGSVARGICRVSANGDLESIQEFTRIQRDGTGATNTDPEGKFVHLTGNEVVSMNMWGFTLGIFPQLGRIFTEFLQRSGRDLTAECFVPAAVNALVTSGKERVRVLHSPDPWFGVTYRDDRSRVMNGIRSLVESGTYEAPLWK